MIKKMFLTTLSVIFIFGLCSFNINASEDERENTKVTFVKEVEEDKQIALAKEAVLKFYRNRDLGEKNDLTPYFSKDMLRLMNYKIMYNNYKQKELDISYSKYDVVLNPAEQEKCEKTENHFKFNLQVLRKFYYTNSDIQSGDSIVLEFTVSKNESGNFIITRCYQKLYSEVNEDEYNRLVSINADTDKWLDEQFEQSKESIKETKKINEENMRQYKAKKNKPDLKEPIRFLIEIIMRMLMA